MAPPAAKTTKILYGSIAVLLFVYVLWPYGSLVRLWFALRQGDRQTVAAMVDWPSVRDGFETDILRAVKRRAAHRFSLADGQAGVTLTFESISLSRDLADRLATPDAMILIFRNPQLLRCIGANVKLGSVESIARNCASQNTEGQEFRAAESSPASLEGPNIARLLEKTDYAFFTGIFGFRLNINHDGVPIEIRLARQGPGWRVVRVASFFG